MLRTSLAARFQLALKHLPLPVRMARAYVRYWPTPLLKATIVNASRDRVLRRPEIVRLQAGGRMLTNRHGELAQAYLWWFGVWEPQISAVFQRALREGDIAIDVGANVGYYSVLAGRSVGPSGEVHAIEPHAASSYLLQMNLDLNGLDWVQVRRAACADVSGSIELHERMDGELSQVGVLADGPRFSVPAVRVDDLLRPEDWPRCRLLKIDVEGAELDVLRGATDLLSAAADMAVCCEVSASRVTALHPDGVAEILDTMNRHGFSAFLVKNDGSPDQHARRVSAPSLASLTDSLPHDPADLVFIKGDPFRPETSERAS